MDGQQFTIETPNEFCEVWLKDNYLSLMQDAVAVAAGCRLQVKFKVASAVTAPPPAAAASCAVRQRRSPKPKRPRRPPNALPTNGELACSTPRTRLNRSWWAPTTISPTLPPRPWRRRRAKSYNPLFLYGGVGLGKTHLLHAIGQHVAGNKKGARVAYVSSEKFTNEYIDAIQNNKLVEFPQEIPPDGRAAD